MTKLQKLKKFALEHKAVIAVSTVAVATVALVVVDLMQKDEILIIEEIIPVPEA